MFRLLATIVAVSLACGISAGGVQAGCHPEIGICFVPCSGPHDNKMGACKQSCRVVVCEFTSETLAKSQLPNSELPSDQLPSDRLPQSRMPDDRLPD